MKRIYYVSLHYPPVARTQRVADCCAALAQAGYEVEVVTAANPQGWANRFPRDDTTEPFEEHVQVTRLPLTPWGPVGETMFVTGLHPCPHMNFAQAVERYLIEALQERPGIVLGLYPPLASLLGAERGARSAGAPLVVDFRDEYYNLAIRSYGGRLFKSRALHLEREIVQAADLVACTTEMVKENLIQRHNVPAEKLVVIYNGVGGPLPDIEPTPRSLPLTIVYAGAITAAQEAEVLAQAHALLRQEKPAVAAQIHVRYFGPETRYAQRALVPHLHAPAVTWGGFVPVKEALTHIAEADLGFFSLAGALYAYATPSKLFEYIGYGKPVVAAVPEHGAAAELVRQHDVGVVTPAGNVPELAAALVHVTENLGDLLRYARHALQVRETYTLRHQMTRLAEAISARLPPAANTQAAEPST